MRTIKDIIDEEGFIIGKPIGSSMLPLLKEEINKIKLVVPGRKLKKYDIALYQRLTGEYVIHRVIKRYPGYYIMCGDNQTKLEPGITDDMIIGIMDGYYTGEKYTSCTKLSYRLYSFWRVFNRPFREIWYKIATFFKQIFYKL